MTSPQQTTIQQFVAIAAAAAARLGIDPRDAPVGRSRALVELLRASGREPRDADTPGAALVAEVIRRDRAYDPVRDSWSLQLDARALAVAPLLSRGAPAATIELLAPADGACLLDAGGGLGDATQAFLARAPHGRAILVDTPPVIAAARRRLATVEDRVTFLAADLRTGELPRCDIALLANVLHLHTAADRDAIVGTVARAVTAGGTLAVKDVALADDREGPLAALAFGLAAVVFGDGEVGSASQLAAAVRAAGRTPHVHRLAVAPECIVVIS